MDRDIRHLIDLIMSMESGLANIAELVDSWLVNTGFADEDESRLTGLLESIAGLDLPAAEKQKIISGLEDITRRTSQFMQNASSFRSKLQIMFHDQIDLLRVDLRQMHRKVTGLSGQEQFLDSSSSMLISTQEIERKRIAREIHDGPAQNLASLVMRIDLCADSLDKPELIREELSGLRESLIRNLKDIRRFIFDLRPMALDDLGLIPTIEQFLSSFRSHTGMNVTFDLEGTRVTLPPERELAVFRVVQEAMNNSSKYSHAALIRLHVQFDNVRNQLNCAIKDNGDGFDLIETRKNYGTLRKMGLVSMEERLKMLGGRFEIVSAPGEGTVVSFSVPL